MSKIRFIVCAILLLTTISAFSSTKFIDSNFEDARVKAETEGKMLLLDFYASWCAPCRFMESTTFQDPNVSAVLNEKFVPVKINIDDFDGYALKEHFDVKVLPTFIIFSSDGKVIERIEETLSPTGMMNILEKNLATHKPKVRPANVSPKTSVTKKSMEAHQPAMAQYKIQLGVYNSYEKTLGFYNKVASKLDEPVVILHDYKGGSIIYRVLIGNFATTEAAHYYLTDLKTNHGIQGHIYI